MTVQPVRLGDRLVGPGSRPLVIAEAAINHQGDFEIAKRLVYVAHAMGADSVKFQMHVLENEMLKDTPRSANFEESLYETLQATNLSVDEHRELKSLCESLGIMYLCTPFSRDAADILEELGVVCYKTGSGELTNLPLQRHVAAKGKPVIVSTGMSLEEEVAETVAIYEELGTPLVLTHCVSAYPTPYEKVNLGVMARYRDRFGVPVGLSDHSRGIYTALGAVALGAAVLEKHFTLDKLQKGPDHAVSIEPPELADLVLGAEAIYKALGDERRIFEEEAPILAWARESVVSELPISAGEVIEPEAVWVKRPAPGPGQIPAKDLDRVIGKRARTDIEANRQLKWDDIE